MADADTWDKAKLMGTGEEGKGADMVKDNPMLWGVPGYLTEEDADTYFKFKEDVNSRDAELRKTVYSFGEVEGEVWCLTRWLRARKFDLPETIKMIEEATECHKVPRENDYYSDPAKALGCDVALYFANYPQLYTGKSKIGAPIFISKPGVLNTDAIECITTLDGILKFHWWVEMHEFGNLLRNEKEKNDDFKLFQCFSILDLEGLTTSQLTSRALAIIKEQAAVDSLCFPETMSRMFIINSPLFFSASWRLIKGWLDPRTASKIDVVSSKDAAKKKLLELIDEDQLPVDYGGTGPDTKETLRSEIKGDAIKIHSEMMYLRGSGSFSIEVSQGEYVEVEVWTRSTAGGGFSVVDHNDKKNIIVDKMEVKHEGTGDEKESPTRVVMTKTRLAGPMHLRVKAESNAGRFSCHNYLLAFIFFDKPN
ncbi:Phosphatidylinositol/phosphatidylcholine transfer protein [Seminavis robusta]|uniref:Phosphatidylinositol/phosphatidylcholine transfer protein n=1 Tax=Seminavis robusta TaxID=568900 RepID=A0A9N8HBD7_9STRA|nr:Phosphatidylinositol/phosphatidylcholine transfer protein [Seminavis robusta]|eukprot:Sro273_g105100.1 Phosphatidylinositol/phosphatidylcholine transfer protein (423) ;mRNA; f:26706-28309